MDISVIITAYNCSSTISEALDSVNLPYPIFSHEIIVYDDGSTDRTYELCSTYESLVPIKIIRSDINLGRPLALIKAIENSAGKFIAILDSDDISLSNRLRDQFEILESNPGIDLVSGQYIKFGRWGKSNRKSSLPSDADEISDWFKKGRNPIAHSSAMFRRDWYERFGGYNPMMNWAQDFDLFARGFTGNNYKINKDVYFLYRTDRSYPTFSYWRKNRLFSEYIDCQNSRGLSTTSCQGFNLQSNPIKDITLFIVYLAWLARKRFLNY